MKIVFNQPVSFNGSIVSVAIPETPVDFEKYYQLRWEILRKPWEQPRGSELDSFEKEAQHFCLVADDDLLGVARVQMNDGSEAQIRFMGIAEKFRGNSFGNLLLHHCERAALNYEAKSVFLQARENAVPFYQRNGYAILEKTFLLFNTIQHFSMRKTLSQLHKTTI